MTSKGASGRVYVMTFPMHDRIKVGISRQPASRAKQINGSVAFESEWIESAAVTVEREVHRLLSQHRVHGEYFAVTIEQAAAAIAEALRALKAGEINRMPINRIVTLSDDLAESIARHAREGAFRSEAEAMRDLMRRGLIASGYLKASA